MRKRDFQHFAREHLCQFLPGWSILGQDFLRRSDRGICLNISFDPSRWAKREWSHIYASVWAIYGHANFVSMDVFVDLIRPDRRQWELEDDENSVMRFTSDFALFVGKTAIPFLRKLQTPSLVIRNLEQIRNAAGHRLSLADNELLLTSCCLLSRYEEARMCWRRMEPARAQALSEEISLGLGNEAWEIEERRYWKWIEQQLFSDPSTITARLLETIASRETQFRLPPVSELL